MLTNTQLEADAYKYSKNMMIEGDIPELAGPLFVAGY